MDNDGKGCQGLCAELFALCCYYSWRQSATPAGYAAIRNQAQRDPALLLPVIRLLRDGMFRCLLVLMDELSGYLWLVPCRTAESAATVDALMRWFAVFCVVLL
jgi:hypothetical protein